ncbi:MAG: TonB-dependent receptor [Vicinamibacterales bacterium]
MRARRVACVALAVALTGWSRPAAAQAVDQVQVLQQQIEQLRKEFGDRIAALEAQLAAVQNAPPPAPMPPPEPVASPAAAAVSGAKVFNPDMAMIGNFLGAAGKNAVNPAPALQMSESELSLQAVVDPYARADFYLSFGESGVDLEEGFLTFNELPGRLLVKVGKMRAAFGKVNTMHTHVLPWADRPLVTASLIGGEEGLSDTGVSVSRLIPAGSTFLEATGQVLRGDAGDSLFKSSTRADLSYVGHLRAYHDITESTNLDLGASWSRGHNAAGVVGDVDLGRFTTTLFGVDATVHWRPLTRAIYRQFIGRTEVVWSRRGQFDGRQDALGYYVSGDYQFAQRWFAGGRYDHTARAADATLHDSGGSAVLTYRPSEFTQIRGQYRRTLFGDGPTANELLFQAQFSIGAHGAHVF